jgi:serine/threonine-protein kinase
LKDTHFSPGCVFAERYRIERLLARGGFGAVYVAEQLATEAQVALKILWPHILGSEAAVASFQQEARIAGRVKSAHIVRVLDAGFDPATSMPYLAMELLEGEDLERRVEQSGPLSPELVVELVRQLGSALDKAHGYVDREGVARPIVHRDLKPENLFLTRREDGGPILKVLDFGIAKVLSATSKLSQEVKGTPLYMAYEQASGGSISPRTDVWAVGLIAFFLLYGKSYWKAVASAESSLTLLFAEVITLPIDAPSVRAAELGCDRRSPAGFDRWFLRCVNRDPDQRYAAAGQAAAALAEVFGLGASPATLVEPLSAGPPTSLGMPAPSTVAINPVSFDPTLLSARAMGAATAHGLSVTSSRPDAQRVFHARRKWVAVAAAAGISLVCGAAFFAMRADSGGVTNPEPPAGDGARPERSASSFSASAGQGFAASPPQVVPSNAAQPASAPAPIRAAAPKPRAKELESSRASKKRETKHDPPKVPEGDKAGSPSVYDQR